MIRVSILDNIFMFDWMNLVFYCSVSTTAQLMVFLPSAASLFLYK